MNIKKIRNKHLMLAFIFIFITKSIFCMPNQPNYGQLPIPSAEEIEEIMKTPDFQNMMDELEKIFAEEDLQIPEKPQPIKEKTTIPKKKPQIQPKHQNIEEHFLKPITQDSAKNSNLKLIKKLPQEKIDAFNYFISRFLKNINTIEKRINSFEFGISFKEYMEKIGFGESVNKINVAINQIKSKKLYLKVFFLPTNTPLRKEIINSLKESEKIEQSISDEEEGEKEIAAFMQQIASTESEEHTQPSRKAYDYAKATTHMMAGTASVETFNVKEVTKIKLNPLQKKIENLLNMNFKSIDHKISSVALNTQAMEEIEKKKKLRESREKKAIQEQKHSTRYRQQPRYRSEYKQRYQHGTTGTRPYSGPRSRYSNYSKPYTPRKTTYPSYQKTRPEKSHDKTKTASKGQGRHSEEMKQKLNVVKNSEEEIIKLLQKIQKIYNSKKEQGSIKQIYRSELLSKVGKNLDKREGAKSSLSKVTLKQQSENKKFKNAITNFLFLGVRLAKTPEETNEKKRAVAQRIIELQQSEMISPLREYENQIFKKIEGKQNLLVDFNTSAKDIRALYINFAIMNTGPQVNTEKIVGINIAFKGLSHSANITWSNIPDDTFDQLTKITENVGGQNVNLGIATLQPAQQAQQAQPAQPAQQAQEDLRTGTSLNAIIDRLQVEIPDAIKTLFKDKVTKIVIQANMGTNFNNGQIKKIKEAFNLFFKNISVQKRFIPKFEEIFKKLDKELEDLEEFEE